MNREPSTLIIHLSAIVLCGGLLLGIDHAGRSARRAPALPSSGQPVAERITSQGEAYMLYRALQVFGIRVVHLNRFMNLVEYYPADEGRSVPFPIGTGDIRPAYEKGLDAHNWLFIANRTGMVRTVTVVLPESVFREKAELFRSSFFYRFAGQRVEGRSRDLPFMVTKLEDLPVIDEPVIVNVDAGFFEPGSDPVLVASLLREACRDIRALLLIESRDEAEVTPLMRARLREFADAFGASRSAAPVN